MFRKNWLAKKEKIRKGEKSNYTLDQIERKKARYHPVIAVSHEEITPLVANVLELDKNLVHKIIMHSFANLRNWMSYPKYKARINIPDFGSFHINKFGINKDIYRLIGMAKRTENKELAQQLKDYIKYLWPLRQLCIEYEKKTTIDNWPDQSKRPRELAKTIKTN